MVMENISQSVEKMYEQTTDAMSAKKLHHPGANLLKSISISFIYLLNVVFKKLKPNKA